MGAHGPAHVVLCAQVGFLSKAIDMTALSDLKLTKKFLVMNLLADAG
jgi:hypothetical protein